jgi:ribulose-phosphate 3-epimerase
MEQAGADYVHCDIMDGVFVPNISFGLPMVRDLKKHTNIPLDVHLMIVSPEKFIERFAEAGADIITIHAEATMHLDRALQMIRATGKKCGVSLNPHTPLCVLEYVLDNIDMVLLMSVNPGFGGQSFIPSALKKTADLKAMIDARGLDVDIQMDGGIGVHNVREITDAGVNIVVAGSSVFCADDPVDVIHRLQLKK